MLSAQQRLFLSEKKKGERGGYVFKSVRYLFLRSETSTSVDHLDVQLSSTFEESNTLLGGNIVSDFGGVRTVVHQQQVEFANVGDGELAETVRQKVASLLGRTVTDLGHRSLTLETSTHVTINTLGLSPRFLYNMLVIAFFCRSSTLTPTRMKRLDW